MSAGPLSEPSCINAHVGTARLLFQEGYFTGIHAGFFINGATTACGCQRRRGRRQHLGLPVFSESQKGQFWDNALKPGPSACWIWQGNRNKHGYGRYSIGPRLFLAHRVAYFISKGEDPGRKQVCHTCDNPSCINPRHLWLGTQEDNNADCHWKGRTKAGTAHRKTGQPLEKLSDEQVEAIRERFKDRELAIQHVADEYGVTPSTISRIVHRRSRLKKSHGEWKQAKLTEAQVRQIRRMHEDGATQTTIASKFGIDQTRVSKIVTRKQWAHI